MAEKRIGVGDILVDNSPCNFRHSLVGADRLNPVERLNAVWHCLLKRRGTRFTTGQLMEEITREYPDHDLTLISLADILARLGSIRCLNPYIKTINGTYLDQMEWQMHPEAKSRGDSEIAWEEREKIAFYNIGFGSDNGQRGYFGGGMETNKDRVRKTALTFDGAFTSSDVFNKLKENYPKYSLPTLAIGTLLSRMPEFRYVRRTQHPYWEAVV